MRPCSCPSAGLIGSGADLQHFRDLGEPSFRAHGLSPSPFPKLWLCCCWKIASPRKMSACGPAATVNTWPTPAPWDLQIPQQSPVSFQLGSRSLPSTVPGAQEQHRPQPAAQMRPRSSVEAQGTIGFNMFFVVAKFKTLYHRFTFLYLGKVLQRCILLPWIIKQKLSDNEPLGSPQLLLEWEPGHRRPAPAAAGLSAPCRHAAIGTGLPLSLPVISPSRCESSMSPWPMNNRR